MKALLALTNHNIDFCQEALVKMVGCPPVSVISIDYTIPEPTKDTHVLLVPTVATAVRNARVLNKSPNIIVIVFDAPVLCVEIGAQLLDVEKQTLDFVFRYRQLEYAEVRKAVRTALAAKEPAVITRQKIDMSTKLLKRAYGSIIAKFLTFIYKIPDTDRRQEIQKHVFDAWWSGDLTGVKAFLATRYKKNAAAAEFSKELDSKDSHRFLAALAEIRKLKEAGKAVSYQKISKAHKISVFDLRYFTKVRK